MVEDLRSQPDGPLRPYGHIQTHRVRPCGTLHIATHPVCGAHHTPSLLVSSSTLCHPTAIDSLTTALETAPSELDIEHGRSAGVDAAGTAGFVDVPLISSVRAKLQKVTAERAAAAQELRSARAHTKEEQDTAVLQRALDRARAAGVGQATHLLESGDLGRTYVATAEAWLLECYEQRRKSSETLEALIGRLRALEERAAQGEKRDYELAERAWEAAKALSAAREEAHASSDTRIVSLVSTTEEKFKESLAAHQL